MLIIPGFIISWVTFPGVIIHEFAHKKACQWRNIRVHDVVWFSASGAGQVVHEEPRDARDTIAISLAPFLVNTILAAALYMVAIFLLLTTTASIGPLGWAGFVVGWLALSVGWHAIPSRQDAKNVWTAGWSEWRSSIIAALSLPFVILIYVANLLRFFWFDAIYSLAIGFSVLLLLDWIGLTTI